jgi:hypothetical protein
MALNRLEELFTKVYSATLNNKIDWKKNPKLESSYKAEIGKNQIYIYFSAGRFRAVILSQEGDEIGKLTSYSYPKLKELFDLAKRKALKIDENLKEIDSLLDSL